MVKKTLTGMATPRRKSTALQSKHKKTQQAVSPTLSACIFTYDSPFMEDQEDDIEMEDVSTEPELDSITAAVEKRSLI